MGGRDSAGPQRNRPERSERAEAAGPGGRRARRRRRVDPVPLPPKRSLDSWLCSGRLAAARGPWLGFPVLGYYLGKYILSQEYFLKILLVTLNVCLEKNSALSPRLFCPKHRSKPGLKSFPVKSYKLSLIINLQRRRCFLFRIYLSF